MWLFITLTCIFLGTFVLIGSLLFLARRIAKNDDASMESKLPQFSETPLWESNSMMWTSKTTMWDGQNGRRSSVVSGKPKPKITLEDQLKVALSEEKYEEAARIRDIIKKKSLNSNNG